MDELQTETSEADKLENVVWCERRLLENYPDEKIRPESMRSEFESSLMTSIYFTQLCSERERRERFASQGRFPSFCFWKKGFSEFHSMK